MPLSTRRTYVVGFLGTASMLLGALALSASGGQSHYLTFGASLCTGGVALAWLGFTGRRAGRAAWAVTLTLGAAGLFLSLLVVRETVCCMFGYHRGMGYPWGWLDSAASAETMEQIEALRADPGRLEKTVDWPKVVLDGLFWWHIAAAAVLPLSQALGKARP
ncbi:hypothetical protein ETD86_41490 [Nonomuraea turkmeniaca]|uniref:Uncharacterized protein n=1 Tax=Nonomuraea turkmeniaca TaxID=103838 RepID=A0A5S4F1J9_9ACTN|nr:hypothetical protein [Nonomuraea turkmeniaca]TMR09945.1 hypothetical protein ETD86_41490 [Nonomuraea turkmeniaca]